MFPIISASYFANKQKKFPHTPGSSIMRMPFVHFVPGHNIASFSVRRPIGHKTANNGTKWRSLGVRQRAPFPASPAPTRIDSKTKRASLI